MLGEADYHLFNEGTHARLHEKLGAHADDDGVHFAVWAPDAAGVAVIGEWGGWKAPAPLAHHPSGIWHGVVAEAKVGQGYKYRITPRGGGRPFDKADPLAFRAELPPGTA